MRWDGIPFLVLEPSGSSKIGKVILQKLFDARFFRLNQTGMHLKVGNAMTLIMPAPLVEPNKFAVAFAENWPPGIAWTIADDGRT